MENLYLRQGSWSILRPYGTMIHTFSSGRVNKIGFLWTNLSSSVLEYRHREYPIAHATKCTSDRVIPYTASVSRAIAKPLNMTHPHRSKSDFPQYLITHRNKLPMHHFFSFHFSFLCCLRERSVVSVLLSGPRTLPKLCNFKMCRGRLLSELSVPSSYGLRRTPYRRVQ